MDAVSLFVCVYLVLAEKVSRWYTTREENPVHLSLPGLASMGCVTAPYPVWFMPQMK